MVPSMKLECVAVVAPARPDAVLAAVKEVIVGSPPSTMFEGSRKDIDHTM